VAIGLDSANHSEIGSKSSSQNHMAVRPWHTDCLFVSSYAVLLSSFFRFDVLVNDIPVD
jgi:hypothetical protein